MVNQEQMDFAKHLYIPGTVYKDSANNDVFTVVRQDFTYIEDGIIHGEFGKGCLMYNHKWAQLVNPKTGETYEPTYKYEKTYELWN